MDMCFHINGRNRHRYTRLGRDSRGIAATTKTQNGDIIILRSIKCKIILLFMFLLLQLNSYLRLSLSSWWIVSCARLYYDTAMTIYGK